MAGQARYGELTEADYGNLLRTLSATTKGRLFLSEYRRRGQPEESAGLFNALSKIESTMARVRHELKPEQVADELRRVAMTLELACEGATSDPQGDEAARRMALVGEARRELAMLADSLASAGS